MKVDYEELMQYCEVALSRDADYEDAVDAVLSQLPFVVKERDDLIAENAKLKRMTELMAEELRNVEIPPAVCEGCKMVDMFKTNICEGKDCFLWMFERKARGIM